MECDNSNVLSWLTHGPSQTCAKSAVEWRAISRLLEALQEEASALLRVCDKIEYHHVQGELNSSADGLSRLLERQIPEENVSIGTLYQSRYSRVKTGDRPDSVFLLHQPASGSLTEDICSTAWDLNSAIKTFHEVHNAFRRLGGWRTYATLSLSESETLFYRAAQRNAAESGHEAEQSTTRKHSG